MSFVDLLGYGQLFSQGNVQALIMTLLSLFVGFYAVSRVSGSLHAPLMGLTNAISSIVIFVALSTLDVLHISVGSSTLLCWINIVSVFLLSVNIFGGFMITWKMLSMFYNKK